MTDWLTQGRKCHSMVHTAHPASAAGEKLIEDLAGTRIPEDFPEEVACGLRSEASVPRAVRLSPVCACYVGRERQASVCVSAGGRD